MTSKIRIGKFGILIIALVIVVYTIWFVFFQDLIQYILENAISTFSGERDIITGVLGILFIPFLIFYDPFFLCIKYKIIPIFFVVF